MLERQDNYLGMTQTKPSLIFSFSGSELCITEALVEDSEGTNIQQVSFDNLATEIKSTAYREPIHIPTHPRDVPRQFRLGDV